MVSQHLLNNVAQLCDDYYLSDQTRGSQIGFPCHTGTNSVYLKCHSGKTHLLNELS
jgi:hypothetical protein